MSRITARFKSLEDRGRKALVPYLMAGDPSLDGTVPLLRELAGAGADIIEIGVPFSDPMADGPAIQAAAERALAHGTSLADVLQMVEEFRTLDAETPLVLMTYQNPIEAMGMQCFAAAAAAAGVDGVLVVDLPPEEADGWPGALEKHGMDSIFLVSPTTTAARLARITAVARGFIYYVSLKGVTGAGHLDLDAVVERVGTIKREVALPVGVGFGIRDAAAAARIAQVADAVVVGSAIVRIIGDCGGNAEKRLREVAQFTATLRRAMDMAG